MKRVIMLATLALVLGYSLGYAQNHPYHQDYNSYYTLEFVFHPESEGGQDSETVINIKNFIDDTRHEVTIAGWIDDIENGQFFGEPRHINPVKAEMKYVFSGWHFSDRANSKKYMLKLWIMDLKTYETMSIPFPMANRITGIKEKVYPTGKSFSLLKGFFISVDGDYFNYLFQVIGTDLHQVGMFNNDEEIIFGNFQAPKSESIVDFIAGRQWSAACPKLDRIQIYEITSDAELKMIPDETKTINASGKNISVFRSYVGSKYSITYDLTRFIKITE